MQRIAVLSHAKRHSIAVLRLYCAVLCYIIRLYCRAMMRCTTLYRVLLCCAVLRGSAALESEVLGYTVMCRTLMMYCVLLCRVVLHCLAVLHCGLLY
jgi:hypothetical protein